MIKDINYKLIGKACEYYESLGYEYVEVPWTASEQATRFTLPPSQELYYASYKGSRLPLVGSAEQGFIDMMLSRNLLPHQKGYYGVTPCWRDDKVDDLHQTYFMKVELCRPFPPYLSGKHPPDLIRDIISEMLSDALGFFNRYLTATHSQLSVYEIDIIDTKTRIELGSYGYREYKNIQWVYGTGLAEPRLSQVIKKVSNE